MNIRVNESFQSYNEWTVQQAQSDLRLESLKLQPVRLLFPNTCPNESGSSERRSWLMNYDNMKCDCTAHREPR